MANLMASSRERSQFGRRRSNTAQSTIRTAPPTLTAIPLKIGDSKVLNAWVHDVKDSPAVIFNQSWWPGVAEGDLLKVLSSNADHPDYAFLLMVPKDEGCSKPQLQISVPRPIADIFSLRNNGEVTLTKVNKTICCAEYVEFMFQDQYLGRNDMWRLGRYLSGQCIYEDQELSFIGGIAAKIQSIYVGGKKVSSACMTTSTKAIYRSFSAKVTIFIQVCAELWEFAGDGERYNEKIVHSFLPALFAKWREAGTNHTVTIVLISRVYYDDSEIDYAAGPLRQDERGNWYKDFFKVITDLEVIYEWKPTLVSLKNSFWDFQRDVLLTHHYHRATQDSSIGEAPAQVRLVGRLSYAQDGPILEALNLGLNPTETHYIDRSLNLTGASTLLISPGTGYFRVSKQLLRLTTTRMLDQGFVLDLILLTKPPLHQTPVFSFEGTEPVAKIDGHDEKDGKVDPLMMDSLWGGDDESKADATSKKIFWWEPFWMATTFWDRQMDLPFRQDRFVARAKMHKIQMLGLLEHDVLSSIEVPYLPDKTEPLVTPLETVANIAATKVEADNFDLDTFALTSNYNATNITVAGNGGPGLRAYADKRASNRISAIFRIATIEESPKRIHLELPSEGLPTTGIGPAYAGTPVRSPSPSSIRSARSDKSTASSRATGWSGSLSKGTLASKLTPSWLFNPFRSGPSEPQTTQVSASASTTSGSHLKEKQKEPMEKSPATDISRSPKVSSSPIRMPPPSKPTVASSTQQIQPMAIRNKIANRSSLNRPLEEEMIGPHRTPYVRRSPINTPPLDDILAGKRRSASSTLAQSYTSMSPCPITNPTRPQVSILYSQASLARRWQHVYPHPRYKYDLNWKPIVTPGCLPLTVEYLPSSAELDASFDVFSYEFIVDPNEMRSFLVEPPISTGTVEDKRRAWALTIMRGMAAVRLAQGFQFILKTSNNQVEVDKSTFRRTKSFIGEILRPAGAAEVLSSTVDPVYLSMTNEIHRIVYTGETIQVKRYVRRMRPTRPYEYQCLIWPKLGGGYTELSTKFKSDGLENYGWNRLDMLVAGYEHHFNESLRYWRTRFVVIPTSEAPHVTTGPSGEDLNPEEARILGIEKLAEQFTKLRWQPPEEMVTYPHPPVRFLHTTLDPAASVLDEDLMDNLDQIHAAGPLRKKMRSEREIADMGLGAIAKAMREEGAVPIKFYQWHNSQYPNSFTGYDFVSWLVREFRDISSRTQATEWGVRFQEQGLFEHCRGRHTFLDGHYYYRLIGEYSVHVTPKYWFRRNTADGIRLASYQLNLAKELAKPSVGRKNKKRLILSQTMVIDIDPPKRSDQAESVILHHDIIHNPCTVFHFELQWIGTTPRCIEDQLRLWNRTIERYGLRLVEAYVTQISGIRERNPFQSCFPIRLTLPPPIVPDLEKRIPEGKQSVQYFEYALLQAFDFILDVEAAKLYPEEVDVVYSYRRAPYECSQFVHRSGVAFIQVLGGCQGFLFLTNRLMGPGRMGLTLKSKDYRPAAAAEDIRMQMTKFCLDKEKLQNFYDKQVLELPPAPLVAEEPPPLVL